MSQLVRDFNGVEHECEEHRRIIRRFREWLKVPEAQPVTASMDNLMATVCMVRGRVEHLKPKYTERRFFGLLPPKQMDRDLHFLVEALVELSE